MNTQHQITVTAAALDAIWAAKTYADMRETSRNILENNPMVQRLTRHVMAALVGCGWIDDHEMANGYSEIMGHVKDALIENIANISLQDLAAIERAVRNWRPDTHEMPRPGVQDDRTGRNQKILEGLINALDASEGDLMGALQRYINGDKPAAQDAQAAAPLSINEKYAIATARAVMADTDLAAMLDEEERRLIANHRAMRVYKNVSSGLTPDGTPDADATDVK